MRAESVDTEQHVYIHNSCIRELIRSLIMHRYGVLNFFWFCGVRAAVFVSVDYSAGPTLEVQCCSNLPHALYGFVMGLASLGRHPAPERSRQVTPHALNSKPPKKS